MIDARSLGGLPRYSAAKGGGLRCYPKPRNARVVRLLVLHQWGAHATLRPRAGESRDDAAIRRARSVPYHLTAFASGPVVWAWPTEVASWASNGFNRTSLAIGVAGRFPALERDRHLGHSRVEDFEEGLVEALAAVALNLPGLTIVTHRQASRARLADPGEALAQLAVRVADQLGLAVDFDRTIGTGAACPAAWSA